MAQVELIPAHPKPEVVNYATFLRKRRHRADAKFVAVTSFSKRGERAEIPLYNENSKEWTWYSFGFQMIAEIDDKRKWYASLDSMLEDFLTGPCAHQHRLYAFDNIPEMAQFIAECDWRER